MHARAAYKLWNDARLVTINLITIVESVRGGGGRLKIGSPNASGSACRFDVKEIGRPINLNKARVDLVAAGSSALRFKIHGCAR